MIQIWLLQSVNNKFGRDHEFPIHFKIMNAKCLIMNKKYGWNTLGNKCTGGTLVSLHYPWMHGLAKFHVEMFVSPLCLFMLITILIYAKMWAFNLLPMSVILTLPLYHFPPLQLCKARFVKSNGESQDVMKHNINTKQAVVGERRQNWN